MQANTTPQHPDRHDVPSFERRCRELCAAWGEGYVVDATSSGRQERPNAAAQAVIVRTADGGSLEIRLRGRDIEVRATGWPEAQHHGLRRRFQQMLSAQVGAHRETAEIAAELKRRLLDPYARALRTARQQARHYRQAARELDTGLKRAGFSAADTQVVGRQLQVQRPYLPLQAGTAALPSAAVVGISMHEHMAAAHVELRNLSPDELADVLGFVDALMAQRQRQLRLCA